MTDNRRTLNRALAQKLYYTVQNANGKWCFPFTELQKGELVHAAAKRKLEEDIGEDVNVYFPSNCPMAHMTEGNDTYFFMNCIYVLGRIKNAPEVKDFAWITNKEARKWDWMWAEKQVLQEML